MPVSINMPTRQQQADPLEKVANAVSIAKSIYGIYADSKQLDQAIADKAKEREKTDLELGKLKREQTMADEDNATSGALMDAIRSQAQARGLKIPEGVTVRQARTVFDDFIKPKPEKDAYANTLEQMRMDEFKRKKQEDADAFETPFGRARTKEDAKALKEAGEMKSKLDREIGELITLRKEFGAETMNRTAVNRAQQLSKSLLLTKKNLENLGVLSQSDRDIVDAIIPSDPLESNANTYTFGLAADPTLAKLEKFRDDTNSDFQTKLATRLNPSAANVASARPQGETAGMGKSAGPGAAPMPKTVMQNGHVYTLNPKTGKYE